MVHMVHTLICAIQAGGGVVRPVKEGSPNKQSKRGIEMEPIFLLPQPVYVIRAKSIAHLVITVDTKGLKKAENLWKKEYTTILGIGSFNNEEYGWSINLHLRAFYRTSDMPAIYVVIPLRGVGLVSSIAASVEALQLIWLIRIPHCLENCLRYMEIDESATEHLREALQVFQLHEA